MAINIEKLNMEIENKENEQTSGNKNENRSYLIEGNKQLQIEDAQIFTSEGKLLKEICSKKTKLA